jgi:haloalkane dehalogenase
MPKITKRVVGRPEHTERIVGEYLGWLAQSGVLKPYVQAVPACIENGRLHEFSRKWLNQTRAIVKGGHFVEESNPSEVGSAIADFVSDMRDVARPGPGSLSRMAF